MELNDRITQLEDEIKILKNEVQAVLLDLRDSYLSRENPFNPAASPIITQPIIINQPPPIDRKEEKPDDLIPEEEPENELPGVEEPANEPEPAFEPEPANEPGPAFEPEPANEPGPAYKQELTASEVTAHEEVTRAWRPEIEPGSHLKSRETADSPDGKVDLATITQLAQWVAETVKRLGRERTETILDISEMMGHVAPELKNILVKFISPVPGEYSGKVTTRGYLASLIELESLLGRDNKSEVALLYILCQENDHR